MQDDNVTIEIEKGSQEDGIPSSSKEKSRGGGYGLTERGGLTLGTGAGLGGFLAITEAATLTHMGPFSIVIAVASMAGAYHYGPSIKGKVKSFISSVVQRKGEEEEKGVQVVDSTVTPQQGWDQEKLVSPTLPRQQDPIKRPTPNVPPLEKGDILINLGKDSRKRDVLKPWSALKSILILGLPGGGKTTTGAWIVSQAISQGATIALIDKHGRHEDSLTAKLAPFSPFFACEPGCTAQDALNALEYAYDILQARIKGTADKTPFLLVIDEYTDIMGPHTSRDQWGQVKDVIGPIIEEYNTSGRKFGCFCMCIGQTPNASRSGGTEVRDLFTTRILHGMQRRHALILQMADYRETLATLNPGEVLLDTCSQEDPFKVTVPNYSQEHLNAFAQECHKRIVPREEPNIEPLAEERHTTTTHKAITAQDTRYAKALEAYRKGATSARQLAYALGIGKTQAASLLRQMEAAKLIKS
jgi:hypothetical protein